MSMLKNSQPNGWTSYPWRFHFSVLLNSPNSKTLIFGILPSDFIQLSTTSNGKHKTSTYCYLYGKWGSRGLPIPCLGFGLSAGGFWKGKVTGNSITSYLTPKCPSEASSLRLKTRKKGLVKWVKHWIFHIKY